MSSKEKSSSIHKEDNSNKENLFMIYYKLLSEIRNTNICNIVPSKSDLDDLIKSTKYSTIINNIKVNLDIYIQNNHFLKNNVNKETKEDKSNLNISQYEHRIIKSENNVRYLYGKYFTNKLQVELLESKINSYCKMEIEYKKIKNLYSTLNNERKDNEIIILRCENSNLKKTVEHFEEELKKLNEEKKEYLKTISELNKRNDEITNKHSPHIKCFSANITPNISPDSKINHKKEFSKKIKNSHSNKKHYYTRNTSESPFKKVFRIPSPLNIQSTTNINLLFQNIKFREKVKDGNTSINSLTKRNIVTTQYLGSTSPSNSSTNRRGYSGINPKNFLYKSKETKTKGENKIKNTLSILTKFKEIKYKHNSGKNNFVSINKGNNP